MDDVRRRQEHKGNALPMSTASAPALRPKRCSADLRRLIIFETVPRWSPELLGCKTTFIPPGTATWWPERYDGVHLFRGPHGDIFVGDVSERWWRPRFDRWGHGFLGLIAELRHCSRDEAFRWACNIAGIRDVAAIRDAWRPLRSGRATRRGRA
jgi:hypothetical protein